MSETLAALRAAFPVADSWIYFNHAAVAPLAAPVSRAIQSFLDEARTQGSTGFAGWQEAREQTRACAAKLLGAQPDEVAFITCTSQGLLTVAEGMEWAPGDEILVVENDFPANQIPWYRQERHGAQVVVVPRRNGRVPVEAILERLTDRTRLVAVPFVLWDNGYRLDLVALGSALAGHPALFCVDAIQGLGAFPLDVAEAQIDFLAADSHKWLLGVEGIGVFYCRREVLGRLDPPLQSWLSVADPLAAWQPGKALRPDARRFEYATLPTLAIFGLRAALRLLLATGVETMAAHILELTERLGAGLEQRGWRTVSPLGEPAVRSGILAAVPGAGRPTDIVATLTERRVCVAERAGAVRFSPHAWNSLGEVDDLLDRLP